MTGALFATLVSPRTPSAHARGVRRVWGHLVRYAPRARVGALSTCAARDSPLRERAGHSSRQLLRAPWPCVPQRAPAPPADSPLHRSPVWPCMVHGRAWCKAGRAAPAVIAGAGAHVVRVREGVLQAGAHVPVLVRMRQRAYWYERRRADERRARAYTNAEGE
ncbi:hypothetical protein GGX14DRAFT_576147 [Mycena pura]|uniref:Uncharacterized protein n=1 Tax=Mycena pura TaxID=153505 RepID=A0AAD6Y029_9AGAR|nr:hypothetical protein GGX14DRAFT_576147 [Mycena pura]